MDNILKGACTAYIFDGSLLQQLYDLLFSTYIIHPIYSYTGHDR